MSRGIKYAQIPYEDCEKKGYSSGVEIEGMGRLYAKIFQDRRYTEYCVVDKNGAVRQMERKKIDILILSCFDFAEMKDIMDYLDSGKRYCW